MRLLNCALVASFLFVSAVLADYHPEKQPPPFLNHIEKSINNTKVILPWTVQAAGLVWMAASEDTVVEYAAANFTVPNGVSAAPHQGLNITISISGGVCTNLALSVGITLLWEPSLKIWGWGGWYPEDIKTSGEDFIILPGHKITAMLDLTDRTRGAFTLINLTTEDFWAGFSHGHSIYCKRDIQWVLTERILRDEWALPDFTPLVFTDLSTTVPGEPKRPMRDGEVKVPYIYQDHTIWTHTNYGLGDHPFVTIQRLHIPPPFPT